MRIGDKVSFPSKGKMLREGIIRNVRERGASYCLETEAYVENDKGYKRWININKLKKL